MRTVLRRFGAKEDLFLSAMARAGSSASGAMPASASCSSS
jgi:hypothetical protein